MEEPAMIVRLGRDGQVAGDRQAAGSGRGARASAGRRLAGPALAAALLAGLAAGAPASAASTQPHSFLTSVSCTSSTACITVGGRAGHDQRDQIIALSWNGHRWSPQVPANPNHTQPNDLNSIACASPVECFAVGSVGSFNFADHRRLIEMWNGTAWSVQAFGNPPGTLNTFMTGVSCGGPALCFAVGEKNDNTGMTTGVVLEKWNGTAWSLQPPLPQPAGALGIGIPAVSCVSPTDCTAVGHVFFPTFTNQGTLAEHWNGQGWSIEPMPLFGKNDQPALFSVSCSGSVCMATGIKFSLSGEGPLAEWFNGTKWSVTTLATPAGSSGISVEGVACTSAANCYAVGASGTTSGHTVTLIEHWNGQRWSVVPSPNATGDNVLIGISCSSTQSCMAVGRAFISGTSSSTLAMRLSGGSWTITPTPSPG